MNSIGTFWLWGGFSLLVVVVLGIDAFLLGGRKAHKVYMNEALFWTCVWVLCALLFDLALWMYLHHTQGLLVADEKSLEFLTGYVVEKALSIDNLFVFFMIFSYFNVPAEKQRGLLLYGVLGAIFMRLVMILAGIWLIMKFHWILYVFGAFLMATGVNMLFMKEKQDLSKNALFSWITRHLNLKKFFLVLILIEVSDLIFALDSIPAVFAITQDPFIVFTSNIFAIMGLRALYFLLAGMAQRFSLLKYGIAVMLVFIGAKMLLAYWYELPVLIMLGIIVVIIATSIVLSLKRTKKA